MKFWMFTINQKNDKRAPPCSESLFFQISKPFRESECYDISNLSQKEGTASLVVLTNAKLTHSNYRKFKIKNETLRSDFEMLTEV